ncbi:MAG: T9SS type A sorting domain-containing protein [Bacteroidota bacterium]
MCSFNVNITLICTPPVINACPSDITQCDNQVATWTDPVSSGTSPVVICSPLSGSTFGIGTTVVTCIATNACGISSCSFDVNINESPVIGTCPGNITQCDNDVVSFVTPTSTGTPNSSVACIPASGSTFASGTTAVTCTATNSCGSSSCSFNVTINTTPVIGACPADISTCDPVVNYAAPLVTSGFPAATVTCVPSSGSTFTVGAITSVTCTASNLCGSSLCSFNVTVQTPSTAPISVTSSALYGQVCLGSQLTLTANGGSLGTGALWVWYEGGCGTGGSIGTGASITITPLTNGAHVYFVLAEGACGNTGCQSVIVNMISAPPSNTIHYTASLTDGCVGAPAQAISVNTVPNCTFYNWSCNQAGARFNGNPGPYQTTTSTVNVTFVSLPAAGSSGWSICCFGGNACGNTNTICTWVRATLSIPGLLVGSFIGCPGSIGNAYSSPVVGGAASYLWSSTGGIVINGNGSQSVTVDFPAGFVSGTLSVHGQTSCGYNGGNRTITITSIPATPGVISGPSYPCPNASSVYSVPAVPGASSYTWTTTVVGAIVVGTTTTCSITFPVSIPGGSNVSVVANTSCPTSSAVRSKGIASGLPSVPSSIMGPAAGQCGQSGVSYSISPVALAIGYNWTASCGTIVGPTNLSGITVDWPASFTNCVLSVSATNGCGTGTARNLTVIGKPGTPAAISGNTIPCANGVEYYSTAGSAGATNYNWTVPSGAVILGPPNGASILVQWGATNGNISVQATNSCGASAYRTLPCVISCRMSQVQNTAGSFNAEIYPNPASEKITVKFMSSSAGEFAFCIYDVLGQSVLLKSASVVEGINIVDLDISNLKIGVYMLGIKTGNETEQMRLIVQE